MQNKGIIKFFAIVFVIVCLFQLSFTFFSTRVERRAKAYANDSRAEELIASLSNGDVGREAFLRDSIYNAREQYYLDSMENVVIYNPLLLRKYTYKDVKQRELNLGLDLRGGMNVIMEVSVVDVIRGLSGNSTDPTFNQALELARERQKSSNDDYVTLFGRAYEELDPNAQLASVFSTRELKDRVPFNASNEAVLKVIREEAEGAIDRTFNILRTRIDRFGVAQPNIQKLQTAGRILIELPGVKDPDRVRNLLQGTAKLEFWETYSFADPEIYSSFETANERLRSMLPNETSTESAVETNDAKTPEDETVIEKSIVDTEIVVDTITGEEVGKTTLEQMVDSLDTQEQQQLSFDEYAKENPLFAYLNPPIYQNAQGQWERGSSAMVGSAFIRDTARVNRMLASVSHLFPKNLKLMWTIKPERSTPDVLQLIAIKATTRDMQPRLTGEAIADARQDVNPVSGGVEVSMTMNAEGAKVWRQMTRDNIGKQIAIALDNHIYSYPVVNQEISGGQSSISGGTMTIEEAQDLANILKAGKLPAPARIVQEAVVGPSLGQESINAGMWSFLLAFIMILIYMIFFYNKSGWVSCVALIANVFFIFGVLTSFGAVLTLPGIAGLVLTLGMAVDANVIIYERVREELRSGKGLRLAIQEGYKNAYSAIIDSNVTTFLTALVLFIFGSGPVQGFATTLMIGILTSLFTAIFISRLIFEGMLKRNKNISFDTKITHNWFTSNNFNFLKMRKVTYSISVAIILIAIVSLFILGLNAGIDFKGGRTFVVRFDQAVSVPEIRDVLEPVFEKAPEVKTFGPNTQVKITTDYKIDEDSPKVDQEVELILYNALQGFYDSDISYAEFASEAAVVGDKYSGILSSEKVGPTIAYDITRNAILAVVFALIIIFAYIAVRFSKWQYGVAGVICLIHDVMFTLGIFSLFYSIMPFSMEVGQSFIAALLTIIGYSINSTVVIFDRIRENVSWHPKRTLGENVNNAINSTLGRTVNTSASTLVVVLMIFIFGGESVRGFVFALLCGIAAGTYSSIFNAGELAFDMITARDKKKEEKKALKK
ncbi:MAG: protein translocase subunit SecDF [Bacteroidales bacterium]|jgi:SecD/SecF fusion protein|nr:protein translocase subunit SecDF [Bacteroidales bacterium]